MDLAMIELSIIARQICLEAERGMAHHGLNFTEQMVLMVLASHSPRNQESIARNRHR